MTDAAYKVELPIFEGPLDLLLYLVRRHELSILEIPIAFITERYLEYLELMKSLSIDVAAEYLLMAATLAHIKSRELLPAPDPPPPEIVDEGDPRAELIRRLLEYQRYKEAAERLGERPQLGREVFARAVGIEPAPASDAPLLELPVFALLEAFNDVLKKAKVHVSHEVVIDRISLAQRVHELSDRLEQEPTIAFESCFAPLDDGSEELWRHQIVITFLAILEMARLRLIRIHQLAPAAGIFLSRTSAPRGGPGNDTLEDYR